MTRQLASEFLTELPPDEKAIFLARLALELTVAARSTYTVESDDVLDPRALRAFNELQHCVNGNELALLNGTPCYPDELLVQMIFADEVGDVQRQSINAFCRAAEKWIQVVAA